MLTTEQFLLHGEQQIKSCARRVNSADEFVRHECPACRDLWYTAKYAGSYNEHIFFLHVLDETDEQNPGCTR